MANYSLGIKPIPDVEDGHTFTGDNFLQLLPHTKILEGKKGIKFINCNLTNCDIPEDAVSNLGKPQHIEWCSHLRPDFVTRGLKECVENCAHMVSVEKITIDGQVVDTVYQYEHKRVE